MKCCNDYWYNYSETNLNNSPHRLEAKRPAGLFLLDGQPVSRCISPVHKKDVTSSSSLKAQLNKLTIYEHPSPSKPSSLMETYGLVDHTRIPFQPQKYDPNNYYNRLPTPQPEKQIINQSSLRKTQIKNWKHVYCDDNYQWQRVSTQDTSFNRLWLPSHRQTTSTIKRLENKIILEKES